MRRQGPSRLAKFLQSKAVLIVLFFLCLFSVLQLANEVARRMAFTKEINRLHRQMSDLKKQSDSLSDLIEYASTDAYLETEARRKLTLRKPGEQVIVIDEKPTSTDADGVFVQSKRGNLDLWWNYFFADAN